MSGDEDDCCFDCGLPIGDDAYITCKDCSHSYHSGNCAGISEKTLKSKGETTRRQWRCQLCRGAKQKPAVDNTSIIAIAELQADVKNLKDTVTAFEQSMQLLSDKYDTVLVKMTRQENDIKIVQERVEKLEKNEASEQIKNIKKDVDELEWQNRKLNLEIHGIQKTENEDLRLKLNTLATSLDLPELKDSDVVAMHRLPSKADKTPGVIVRFAQQSLRERWFEKRKQLRDEKSSTYIQENLTKQARSLLWLTKQWAKENDFKFVWHSSGKILVRRIEGDSALVVKSKDDLRAMV